MTTASEDIASAAERLLQLLLDVDPLQATLIGFRDRDAQLADLSVEHEELFATARAELRADVEAVDDDALDAQERVTKAVILAQLGYDDDAQAVESIDFTVAAFPVSPASVLLSYLRMVVLTDGDQAEAYLQRLAEIPRYLVQAAERLERGRVAGLYPVAHLVEMAIDQIERFLAAEECSFALEAPPDWSGADDWYARMADILDREVRPAFAAYRDVLSSQALPTGRSNDEPGLAYLPGGRERYERLVRLHTTTDRTPEELHQEGLIIVGRIHEEFQALGAELFDLTDVPSIFERLQSDPDLRWSTAEQILAAAEKAVRNAEAVSVDWFGRLPVAVCALESIPELEAEGSAPAYYMPPSLDGARPGTYFTNVNKPTERTSFDLESVAYHEAVPGHHFQVSVALELPDLPVIRRLPLFTAYVEGWGLYSERLADEMGLYSSPIQRMGMLSADVWRAARLVVDTGLHAFGWSRQRAVEYMLANTPVAPIDVEAEIDRYIAMPGQALSYMTGRIEIQRLRAKAEAELGEAFDIKGFHDTVLGSGGLPLSVLAEVVDSWIEATRP